VVAGDVAGAEIAMSRCPVRVFGVVAAVAWCALVNQPLSADDAPAGLIEVGHKEKDACSKKNVVTVFGKLKDGVPVKAGESRYIEMEAMTTEIRWRCGDSDEKSEYKPAFNWVRCQRSADTGRIEWTFYVKK